MKEMEVCGEDGDAIQQSRLDARAPYQEGQYRTANGNSNSCAGKNSTITSGADDLSRSFLDSKSLLLSLLGQNVENVEYYCQLRDLASQWDEKERGPLICDPRDVRKAEQIGGWQPKCLVVDLKDLLKRCEVENLDFPRKQIAVELDAEGGLTSEGDDSCDRHIGHKDTEDQSKSFQCGVQGCGEVFTSLALHEAHYRRCHSYVCATCRRSFVSNFLLDVHVQENHDSYFQILSSRIDMYRCLVETCSLKFCNAELRKDHLITEHKFPSNFSFHRPLKDVNLSTPVASDVSEMDVAVDCPEGDSGDHRPQSQSDGAAKDGRHDNTSKAQKGSNAGVPSTICFGRGSQRAFQRRGRGGRGRGRGRHWHQTARPDSDTTVDIESVDMKDLADSLS